MFRMEVEMMSLESSRLRRKSRMKINFFFFFINEILYIFQYTDSIRHFLQKKMYV